MSEHHKHDIHHYLFKEFNLAIETENSEQIKALLEKINVADLAIIVSEYKPEKKLAFINLVGKHFPEELFLKLHDSVSEEFIHLIGPKQSARLISRLESPEVLSILEELNEETRNQILSFTNKELKKDLETGFSYPIDSAGRLMHRNFLSVPSHWSVSQIHKYCVRNKKIISNNFYGVFVVDASFKPIGVVPTKELVINSGKTLVSDIMEVDVNSFNYLSDKAELAVSFQKYDLSFAPIVNNDGRILGFVTLDDVIEVIDESAEEDILHLGGIIESDIYTKFGQTFKQRFPWLFLNLITAVIASIVIAFFGDTIKSLVALAVLMPIIASMGGNAGTQTVTIAVRALATKELNPQNTFKIITKEFLIGLTNGLFFSVICFSIIMATYDDMKLATLFAIATVITLGIAGLSGAIIPILIYKLKGDPAISSGVILTTITDVIAFLAFLGLATLFI